MRRRPLPCLRWWRLVVWMFEDLEIWTCEH
jgi:hypothetical protein